MQSDFTYTGSQEFFQEVEDFRQEVYENESTDEEELCPMCYTPIDLDTGYCPVCRELVR